ncbi:DUF3299 domain-containing protein [Vibrio astriarenae]|uniref:DUF3299 domain-containing protein n=1 Tax=Vibrio astriarenae TaxID=1481923 RepID=A0A7Z2YFA7_9VIBR|nr:DUF3299 domain-containing protein [Vibrio astriarenae]QIA64969.1 DUF3299 domain-containing protein [Vibrio astriarenae]
MRYLLFVFTLFLSAIQPANAVINLESRTLVELEWADLIPQQQKERALQLASQVVDHSGDLTQQAKLGDVRKDLNGAEVKIPGFVIPLEGDQNTITEFLLVPFYGACIHVPPPPPNQIIHVKFEEGAPTKDLWDIVYITGTLRAETLFTADIDVESGYTIDGASLELYDKAQS